MSFYDYRASLKLAAEDPPFAALIMAAMRKADTENFERLWKAFPALLEELDARYHSRGEVGPDGRLLRPAGLLPGEPWHPEAAPDDGTEERA